MYVQWGLRFTLSNHTTTSGLTHFSEKGFNRATQLVFGVTCGKSIYLQET